MTTPYKLNVNYYVENSLEIMASKKPYGDAWKILVEKTAESRNVTISTNQEICRDKKIAVESTLYRLEQLAAEINEVTRVPRPVGRPVSQDRVWLLKRRYLRIYRELQFYYLEWNK